MITKLEYSNGTLKRVPVQIINDEYQDYEII